MDIKDFAKLIEAKRGELDTLMRRNMPVIAGRMAKDHFQDNFRKGGFVNGGLHPWPAARRLLSGGSSAADSYGTLLSGRNHLFSSINYYPEAYRVRVACELPYASIHNWGGSIKRTDMMRRYSWRRFFRACGVVEGEDSESRRMKTAKAIVDSNPEARFWKGMALSKKKSIKMPQRQFLGESAELNSAIHERLIKEVTAILDYK